MDVPVSDAISIHRLNCLPLQQGRPQLLPDLCLFLSQASPANVLLTLGRVSIFMAVQPEVEPVDEQCAGS